MINFYALAAGFLTGKYRTEADAAKSARGANTTKKYLNARGLRILRRARQGRRPQYNAKARPRARWPSPGRSRGRAVTAPIASATSITQLEELVAAARS